MISCCNWHHIVVTLDRDANGTIYIDGSKETTLDISGLTDSINPTKLLAIGSQVTDSGQSLIFNGTIDEVRVSNVARSPEWIATSYNNQYNPNDFYLKIGDEELISQAPIISNPSPSNGDINVPISLSELNFTLIDHQSDPMNYTVNSSPYIGSGLGINVGDGRYNVSVSGLVPDTTYIWNVTVTDGTY